MDHRALPKAELHLHVEGALEPELAFALARRNGLTLPWADPAELLRLYQFRDLQSFLDLYYQVMGVLRTGADFFDLARAYLDRAAGDGVRHAELFFDPQAHWSRGVAPREVVAGLTDALDDARQRHGLSGGLILCFLRDLGPGAAAEIWGAVQPLVGDLLGVGLDSAEVGPIEAFAPVFAQARQRGLRLVAHAGEEAPPHDIWQALDSLGVERVDHGLRALEDDALVERLVRDQVPLTVCPLSNVRLQAVAALERHPLAAMLARGLAVTVNSDDPAYFGGYIGDNFEAASAALGLSDEAVLRLCRHSLEAAFVSPQRRAELLAELTAVASSDG